MKCDKQLELGFYWNPFVANQSMFWDDLIRIDPQLVVMNFGYWDLLHHHDTGHFFDQVTELFSHIRVSKHESKNFPRIILLSMGNIQSELTSTEEKQLFMKDELAQHYNLIMESLIDLYKLHQVVEIVDLYDVMSDDPEPTTDGIHPNTEIYATLQRQIVNLSAKPASKPKPSSIGRNPLLGLIVGVYVFLALATGDAFLILSFLPKWFLH